MIYNPVNEVNQSNFFLLIFLKKYRKSTAVLLIWKYRYRYRGTNFSKVPSTGTTVLLQSTVPTYGFALAALSWQLKILLTTFHQARMNNISYFSDKIFFLIRLKVCKNLRAGNTKIFKLMKTKKVSTIKLAIFFFFGSKSGRRPEIKIFAS